MAVTDMPLDVNVGCAHPKARHRHGTYACYVLDKCRCEPCREARARAGKVQARRKLYADHGVESYQVFVDATPAVEHLNTLSAAGLGSKQIAKRSGVALSSIGAMLWGTPSRNRGRRSKCTRETLAKILAVSVPDLGDLAPGRKVDATRTRNRLRALIHIGYSVEELARLSGLDHQPLRHALVDVTTSARTHRAIENLFGRLWNKPNNPADSHAKAAASRSRNWATREGWPMPLDLDGRGYLDADVIPDDDEPIIDTIAINRTLEGDWARLTSDEVMEAIRRGITYGMTATDVAGRLHMSPSAVQQRATRAGLSFQS